MLLWRPDDMQQVLPDIFGVWGRLPELSSTRAATNVHWPDGYGVAVRTVVRVVGAVRQVRTKTRRKYAPEDKIRIVLEGFRREVTVSDLCRREGIKPGVFYAWTKEFMEAGKERLTRDTVRDATRQEIEHLKRENYDLKQLVADLSLEVHRFKKTAIPTLDEGTGT